MHFIGDGITKYAHPEIDVLDIGEVLVEFVNRTYRAYGDAPKEPQELTPAWSDVSLADEFIKLLGPAVNTTRPLSQAVIFGNADALKKRISVWFREHSELKEPLLSELVKLFPYVDDDGVALSYFTKERGSSKKELTDEPTTATQRRMFPSSTQLTKALDRLRKWKVSEEERAIAKAIFCIAANKHRPPLITDLIGYRHGKVRIARWPLTRLLRSCLVHADPPGSAPPYVQIAYELACKLRRQGDISVSDEFVRGTLAAYSDPEKSFLDYRVESVRLQSGEPQSPSRIADGLVRMANLDWKTHIARVLVASRLGILVDGEMHRTAKELLKISEVKDFVFGCMGRPGNSDHLRFFITPAYELHSAYKEFWRSFGREDDAPPAMPGPALPIQLQASVRSLNALLDQFAGADEVTEDQLAWFVDAHVDIGVTLHVTEGVGEIRGALDAVRSALKTLSQEGGSLTSMWDFAIACLLAPAATYVFIRHKKGEPISGSDGDSPTPFGFYEELPLEQTNWRVKSVGSLSADSIQRLLLNELERPLPRTGSGALLGQISIDTSRLTSICDYAATLLLRDLIILRFLARLNANDRAKVAGHKVSRCMHRGCHRVVLYSIEHEKERPLCPEHRATFKRTPPSPEADIRKAYTKHLAGLEQAKLRDGVIAFLQELGGRQSQIPSQYPDLERLEFGILYIAQDGPAPDFDRFWSEVGSSVKAALIQAQLARSPDTQPGKRAPNP